MYNVYLKLKKEDNDKLYLFKCGKFYIFLSEDCDFINQYMVLKKTNFGNNCQKCGFPVETIDDYKKVFENINLNYKIIEDYKIYMEDNIKIDENKEAKIILDEIINIIGKYNG